MVANKMIKQIQFNATEEVTPGVGAPESELASERGDEGVGSPQVALHKIISLMRLDKPIGSFLLLWPTLWALWLASHGWPNTKILLIFITGTVLMRSAGCVFNDIADRHIDGRVARTRFRPLVSGTVTVMQAWMLAALLSLLAFLLVLCCNTLTIALAFIGAGLALGYPYMKRFTHLPQLGLGVAFTWGVPMAFAAATGRVSMSAWVLFFTGILSPIIYDTMYAMADRADDITIGVKSTAILFGHLDTFVIALLQMLFILMLYIVGVIFRLHAIYFFSLIIVGLLFLYQQWLIKDRDPQQCFQAFLNNNWVGLVIFVGIALSYL